MTHRKLAAVAVGLVAAGTIGVALGLAAGNDGGTITACVTPGGVPHLVQAGTACKGKETTVAWNVQGPAGPQGPKGDQGPPGGSGRTVTIVGDMSITGRDGKPMMGGDGHKDKIDVISFEQGIVSPRDAGSGQATGKRQYQPIRIVKRIDASTPLLFQACATNEVLPAVQIHFHPPTGEPLEIKLDDASCTSVSDSASDDGDEQETVGFSFRKITITHTPSATEFQDTWTTAS
jgi:type VI secretion system secreted protein Hcp